MERSDITERSRGLGVGHANVGRVLGTCDEGVLDEPSINLLPWGVVPQSRKLTDIWFCEVDKGPVGIIEHITKCPLLSQDPETQGLEGAE